MTIHHRALEKQAQAKPQIYSWKELKLRQRLIKWKWKSMLMTPESPFVSNLHSGYWQKAKPQLNKVRDEKGAIQKLRESRTFFKKQAFR